MSESLPDANFLLQFAFNLEAIALPELADEVYRVAARLDPQVAEAPYRLGKRALEAKRYDEALRYFEQALERRADLVDARYGLGLAYVAQGKTALYVSVHQYALRHRSPCAIHSMGLVREWEECSIHATPHSF
jgi:tetratricopeptide (TPR) repeat protein